jgi:hypothetical protein
MEGNMVTRRNADGTPTGQAIRSEGAIPYASQIENDSSYPGAYVDDALTTCYTTVGARQLVKVSDVVIRTLNNEQSTAMGGSAANQFCPTHAVVHLKAVGVGAAANGDVQISIGTSTGGTQIKTAGAATGLTGLNAKFIFDLTGAVKAAIPCNSTVYVKVTTADTTAGVGHLADVYLYGDVVVGGA